MTRNVLLLVLILTAGTIDARAAESQLPTPGPVINIVEWDGNALPPVYERSEQPPLTQSDLTRLVEGGFEAQMLSATVRERRYSGDVSADGLLALKAAGVPAEVIRAASLHALPPNRELTLTLVLEFDGTGVAPRQRFLYIIVPDGDIDRVFTADLGTVLDGRWKHDVQLDGSDPLLPRPVRRVTFSARVPLKRHGDKEMHIFTSARPGLRTLADRPASEGHPQTSHGFRYPTSSLYQDCRLFLRFKQDALLENKWAITGSTLDCEWD